MKKIRECFFGRLHYVIETDGEIYKVTITSDLIYYHPTVMVFENVKELNSWIDSRGLENIINKVEIKAEINNFCHFLDDMYSTLLDSYTMKDWNMSWSGYLEQAQIEIKQAIEQRKMEKEE